MKEIITSNVKSTFQIVVLEVRVDANFAENVYDPWKAEKRSYV